MFHKKKIILSVFCCMTLSATAADKLADSTAMFTESALQQCDFGAIEKEVAAVMTESKPAFAQTEALIAKIKNANTPESKAVIKRFEIACRLRNYIKSMNKGDAGQKLLAWQGAKEMQVLLDYFKAEQKRFEKRQTLPAPVKLSIKDFGALGDGKNDDGPAFRKAFEAAKALKGRPVVLSVPEGVYRIVPENRPLPKTLKLRMADEDGRITERPGRLARAHLLLTNACHFTLQGEKGTQLLFTDSTMLGLRLLGCRESVLQNIAINYADNPSTQGKIVKVEKSPRAMIFKVDPGFPAPDDPRFLNAPSRRFTPRYPGKPHLYGNGTGRVGKVERLDDGTFRIYPLSHEVDHYMWKNLKAGARYSIFARYDPTRYDASAVDLRYCGFSRLENVVVYKSPGVAFRIFRNNALILSGCRIEIEPGKPDYISSNADGCQASGPVGPYVENCYFSNMEDDGFNFNSPSLELASVTADRMRSVPFASQGAFLVSGVTGEVKAVLQTSPDSRKRYLAPLPKNCITNEQLKNMSVEEKLRMDFFGANAGKFKLRPDRLVTMPSDLSGTVIVNTEFRNIRGLALQITAANILVENCKITHMTGYGININTMLPWGMCFNPHNVVVRNTVIEDCMAPAVSMQYRGLNHNEVPPARSVHDILLENCSVKQKAWCGVEIKNAGNVKLVGNKFITGNPKWKSVYCQNFRDLVIKDCQFKVTAPANAIFCKDPQETKFIAQENNKIETIK